MEYTMLISNLFWIIFFCVAAALIFIWIDMARTAKRLLMKGGWYEMYIEFHKKLLVSSRSLLDSYEGKDREILFWFYLRTFSAVVFIFFAIMGGVLVAPYV